ncbi:MAG TPA: hypothetical protein VIK74_07520, partial [Parasegetibacter sp.]
QGDGSNSTEAPAPTEDQKVDYESWLQEVTGGKVKTPDELKSLLEAPSNPPELEFANDESKQLFELLKEGKTKEVIEYYQLQEYLSGVDKMSDEEVLYASLQFKDPQASEKDIQTDMELLVGKKPNKDAYDDDQDGKEMYEDDMRAWNRRIRMQAVDAKKYLESLKKDIKLPEIPKQEKQPEFKGFTQEELDKDKDEFSGEVREAVSSALSSFKSISIPVVDKDQGIDFVHEITLTDQDRAALASEFSDYIENFDNRYSQGGKYDGQKLARDRFVADNFEKLIASAVKSAYSKGRLSVLSNAANSSLRPENISADPLRDQYLSQGRAFIRS